MKTAGSSVTALLAALLAWPVHASPQQGAPQRPLSGSPPHWTKRPFQAAAAESEEPEGRQAPEHTGRDADAPQHIRRLAELEERVQALEAELATLREALRAAAGMNARDEDDAVDGLAGMPRLNRQEALADLETLATDAAAKRELVMTRKEALPAIESGGIHRARIRAEVTGAEERVYQWLHHLHTPAKFRALTSLELTPGAGGDSSVTAGALFEQWHLPADAPEQIELAGADLRPLTEPAHYPLEVLLNVVQANPSGKLRLERAEIDNRLDAENKLDRSIRLVGVADELAQVVAFKEALRGSEGLKQYRWFTPPAVEGRQAPPWRFAFEAAFDPE